ncbi:pre-B lymphocyte protein 3 isoform 2-T2 [Molossus nigricans]
MGPSHCLPPPINGLICMLCRGPVASLKHLEQPTEQLLPASLLLAMAWWCLALLLIGTLLAGQVAQISCMLSPRHATIQDYGVSWYQQRPGSAPRYLLYYRSEEDHHRPPDIPDRFSAAIDAAHNACILIISPVQPEDDADYYCSVGYVS